MPKYRLLTNEELKGLESEFINYLIVNSITAEDWQKLKQENLEEAEKIIDLFSDVVFEKILRTTNYVKHQTPFFIKCIQCNEKEMHLYALNTKVVNNFDKAELYKGTKAYEKQREIEIFELLEEGFEITSENEFLKVKNLVLPGKKNI